MQTFMPEGRDFAKTAYYLDDKRLNKQGVEAYQIFRINAGVVNGFKNHPACLMWRGYESTLLKYATEIYKEIDRRGFNTNTMFKITDTYQEHFNETPEPYWFNDIKLILTHRGNLFKKFPEHYEKYSRFKNYKRYTCCVNCNYYWPTHKENL